jgi:hypothetical protein
MLNRLRAISRGTSPRVAPDEDDVTCFFSDVRPGTDFSGFLIGLWLSSSCQYSDTETSDRHSFERRSHRQQSQRAGPKEMLGCLKEPNV